MALEDLSVVHEVEVVVAPMPARVRGAPSDVLRLVVAIGALAIATLAGAFFDAAITAFLSDLLSGLASLPDLFWSLLGLLALVGGAVILVAAAVAVVRGHHRALLLSASVAAVVAGLAALGLTSLADDSGGSVTGAPPAAFVGRGDPTSTAVLAGVVAIAATVSPWLGRRRRRQLWAVVVAEALIIFVSSPISFDVVLASLIGWVAGATATVIFGAPSHRPRATSVAAGLASAGCPLKRLAQADVDARGSTPYFAVGAGSEALFVKALGADERSADLLFRAYRRIQPRDLGDERRPSSLKRAVEHEAFVALAAGAAGVRTPRLVAFASAEPAAYVLAYEAISGRSLDRIPAEELTDDLLDQTWEQLGILRRHRIAHRDLRLANLFRDDRGVAWIIDFGFSEAAASEVLLASDVAELVASSATVVGVDRAIAAARRGVGPGVLASARPRMRLPMFSGATRTAMKAAPGLLDEVVLRAAP